MDTPKPVANVSAEGPPTDDDDGPQCYSSDEMHREWQYSGIKITPEVEQHPSPSYESYTHAVFGPKFSKKPGDACLNADEGLLAIADGRDIQVFDTTNTELKRVLKGHPTDVTILAFHPKDPLKLLSASQEFGTMAPIDEPLVVEEPLMMLWSLDTEEPAVAESEHFLEHLGGRGVQAVMQALKDSQSNFALDEEEQKKLAKEFAKLVSKLNAKHQVAGNTKIAGELKNSHEASWFSKDGNKVIYTPASHQKSPSVREWDLEIWNLQKGEKMFTLHGHSDSTMWTGFSPDDKLIGTVNWDRSFKIWDAIDGTCLHTFKTKGQNWIGGFSPDSKYFAGTSGDGILWIYELATGKNVVSYDFKGDSHGSWGRALDWHLDTTHGKYKLALGTNHGGRVFLFGFDGSNVELVRKFDYLLDNNPTAKRKIMGSFLETSRVRFLDDGRKLAWCTYHILDLMVYDIERNKIWRIARNRSEESKPAEPGDTHILFGNHGLIVVVSRNRVSFLKLPGDCPDRSLEFGRECTQVAVEVKPSAQAVSEGLLEC